MSESPHCVAASGRAGTWQNAARLREGCDGAGRMSDFASPDQKRSAEVPVPPYATVPVLSPSPLIPSPKPIRVW